MAQPGSVFTADTAKNYLKNYNKNYLGEKTWLEAFNAIDKNYNAMATDLSLQTSRQESANVQDYSNNIAEAYKNAMLQRNQIAASNLGEGFKGQLSADVDASLNNAYNAYLQNYMSNKQNIQSNYLSNMQGIYEAHTSATDEVDKLLTAEAQNTADYLNAHTDFISYLLNDYLENNPEKLLEDQFQDYVNYEMESGILTPTSVKDVAAIRDMMFDKDKDGQYVLNDRGKDFFRQVQHLGLDGDGMSFGTYLYENNPELYEWAIGTNQYDSTYSDAYGNTNRAAALGAIGLADRTGHVNDGDWKWTGGTVAENYAKNAAANEITDKAQSAGTMTLKAYNADKGSVTVISNSSTALGDVANENDDNFTFTLEGEEGTYEFDLEITSVKDDPDAKMTDEDVTNLNKAVGGLSDNALYYYDNTVWIAIKDKNGAFDVRKVQAQHADEDEYDDLVKILKGDKKLIDVFKKRMSPPQAPTIAL